jgi:hypothetical protein
MAVRECPCRDFPLLRRFWKNRKGKTMKISRIAVLAGFGMVAMTLPAAAAPVTTVSTDVRAATPAYMQLAQVDATRAASEARGGDFKPKKSKKKSKKK